MPRQPARSAPQGPPGMLLPADRQEGERARFSAGETDEAGRPSLARATLIVNPFASGVSEKELRTVERTLGLGWQLETHLTERPGHATELARQACLDSDRVYVFSGDGVYNEALNGLDGTTPIGFVPGGGTSVLPRALGLSRDPVAAAAELLGARERRISLGRVNGRRFAFNASIGLDAEVVWRIESHGRRSDGRRPGDVAFAWAAIRALAVRRFRLRPELEIEGLGRAAMLVACNCEVYTYAGSRALVLAPAARFELGLDLVTLERAGPIGVLRTLGGALAGSPPPGLVRGHDLDRFEARCDRPLRLQADGEVLGEVDAAVFEAERDAVSVLVPAEGRG